MAAEMSQPAASAEQVAELCGRRLQSCIRSNFIANTLPASEAAEMLRNACKAKTAGCQSGLAKSASTWRSKSNLHRNLMRGIEKESTWPKLYYADITVVDRKAGKSCKARHPFLLPHEVLAALREQNGDAAMADLCVSAETDPALFQKAWETARSLEAEMSQPDEAERSQPAGIVGVGLHADGVPLGTAGDSVENVAYNFCCSSALKWLRVLFTCIPKRWAVKQHSMDDILEIFRWSMLHCALGRHPRARHDGSPFLATEKSRAKKAGMSLPKAMLLEIRADWAWLKQGLGFPAWNEKSGICFLCKATPDNYKDMSDSAVWKTERVLAAEFHRKILETGGYVCPLFKLPGVCKDSVVLDWLHNVDAGVSADFAGNALLELVDSLPGATRRQKCSGLWGKNLELYSTEAETSRKKDKMDELKPELFIQPKKSPKLRCKAAVVRHFVPVLCKLLQEVWAGESCAEQCTCSGVCKDAHRGTVKAAAAELLKCYKCLDNWDPDVLQTAARRFATLLIALEGSSNVASPGTRKWRVKPKLHYFMELTTHMAKTRGNPAKYWVYADESFGGKLRNMAELRGGKNSARRVAENLLLRFRAKQNLPVI